MRCRDRKRVALGGPTVGILTFHRCISYGHHWQARCLVDGLRDMGINAVILDHDCRRVRASEWKCALHPHPATRLPSWDLAFYGLKLLKLPEARRRLPRSRRLGSTISPRFPEACLHCYPVREPSTPSESEPAGLCPSHSIAERLSSNPSLPSF